MSMAYDGACATSGAARAAVGAPETNGASGGGDAAALFDAQPVRVFRGHGDDVFDLSWSSNSFLLSASRDKTVRLWHLSTDAALKTFRCAAGPP